MAKDTSIRSGGGRASTQRKPRTAGPQAARILKEAREEANRLLREAHQAAAVAEASRTEAEERARGLLLDARASADGVRAEGMEIVSDLRQMGDSLRANAERLLRDVQDIHARMLSRLEEVEAGMPKAPSESGAAGAGEADAAGGGPASPPAARDDELDVPDFVSPG